MAPASSQKEHDPSTTSQIFKRIAHQVRPPPSYKWFIHSIKKLQVAISPISPGWPSYVRQPSPCKYLKFEIQNIASISPSPSAAQKDAEKCSNQDGSSIVSPLIYLWRLGLLHQATTKYGIVRLMIVFFRLKSHHRNMKLTSCYPPVNSHRPWQSSGLED